jgi:hypothetical protein
MVRHQINIVKLLQDLGIPQDMLLRFARNPDFNKVIEVFDNEIKPWCRKRKKQIAFENHPDRGGDGQRLIKYSQMLELLEKIRLTPKVRRPQPVQIFYYTGFGGTGTTTSTSDSTGSTFTFSFY